MSYLSQWNRGGYKNINFTPEPYIIPELNCPRCGQAHEITVHTFKRPIRNTYEPDPRNGTSRTPGPCVQLQVNRFCSGKFRISVSG